jgi:glycosyltransferase involved in cell wall biosynthesis
MSGHLKISVVTPSLNQEKFIEENIQSILNQNYPNFEHIIIDGGSSDRTIEILKRYPHVKWISEPDRGQADALNKGFRMAKGDVIGWLNSDDSYLPGTFELVARTLDKSRGRWVVMGDVEMTDEYGSVLEVLENKPKKFHQLLRFWDSKLRIFHQPGVFFSKEILERVGFLDESLYFAMDYDLWLRVSQKLEFHRVNAVFARYRLHGSSKSSRGWDAFMPEWELVSKRYTRELPMHYRVYHLVCCAAFKANLGGWLPRNLRKLMGLPKTRKALTAAAAKRPSV